MSVERANQLAAKLRDEAEYWGAYDPQQDEPNPRDAAVSRYLVDAADFIEALAARAAQMEADLLRYGNHTPSCPRRMSKHYYACNCEWTDVLGAIAKAEFARAAVGEAAAASPSGEPG